MTVVGLIWRGAVCGAVMAAPLFLLWWAYPMSGVVGDLVSGFMVIAAGVVALLWWLAGDDE